MAIAHCYIQSTSCHGEQHNKYRHACHRAGFSTGKKLPHVALSGCHQPHQAFNPVSIHQIVPPKRGSTHPINRLTTHLSTPEG